MFISLAKRSQRKVDASLRALTKKQQHVDYNGFFKVLQPCFFDTGL